MSDYDNTIGTMLDWIGDHAGPHTEQTLRSVLRRCTEADIASVKDTMRRAQPRDRAAWIVGSLKNARHERTTEPERHDGARAA